ncbi:MAG TPA: hypothetical protein VFM69_08655 [Pricia sp.]|nr:hypothetical protein [Pricia sp.]
MEERNRDNPFKTPEGYFGRLADILKVRLSQENTGHPDSDSNSGDGFSVLEGDFRIPESGFRAPESGFTVPEGYFESLQESIRQKLEVEVNPLNAEEKQREANGIPPENEETKVIRLDRYKKYYYAAASIAALALTLFALTRNTSMEITFEDIANSDIEHYFEDNEMDFSAYEMAEIVPIDELEINDMLSDPLNDEVILEYVDNNTDNYENLNLDDEEPN